MVELTFRLNRKNIFFLDNKRIDCRSKNATSPQFTFMFPNLTETKRISDGYWYDNTYHASFMACKDENVVYFASSWQVVSPTGTVTYDVYAR